MDRKLRAWLFQLEKPQSCVDVAQIAPGGFDLALHRPNVSLDVVALGSKGVHNLRVCHALIVAYGIEIAYPFLGEFDT